MQAQTPVFANHTRCGSTSRWERNEAQYVRKGMKVGGERERHAYKPGDAVPTSGIYTAVHIEHRADHDIVAIQGEQFPRCRRCGEDVRFLVARLLPHMTHDFDLAGPEAHMFVKRRAKAAGEEAS